MLSLALTLATDGSGISPPARSGASFRTRTLMGQASGLLMWMTTGPHKLGGLKATVSLEQLRQGSVRSNHYFDSTTAEVCATIKERTGAMGKSWEVHP